MTDVKDVEMTNPNQPKWKNQVIELGIVKPKSKHKLNFEFIGDANVVEISNVPCGCSEAKLVDSKNVEVMFTAPLAGRDLFDQYTPRPFSRYIEVMDSNNATHKLRIIGTSSND